MLMKPQCWGNSFSLQTSKREMGLDMGIAGVLEDVHRKYVVFSSKSLIVGSMKCKAK